MYKEIATLLFHSHCSENQWNSIRFEVLKVASNINHSLQENAENDLLKVCTLV